MRGQAPQIQGEELLRDFEVQPFFLAPEDFYCGPPTLPQFQARLHATSHTSATVHLGPPLTWAQLPGMLSKEVMLES